MGIKSLIKEDTNLVVADEVTTRMVWHVLNCGEGQTLRRYLDTETTLTEKEKSEILHAKFVLFITMDDQLGTPKEYKEDI